VIRLVLPYPISANEFKQTYVPKGWTRPKYYVTNEAKAWKEEAQLIAKVAGFKQPTTKPVDLHVVMLHRAIVQTGKKKGQKNGHVFDLDNVLKVSLDGLKGVVYVDDKQIKRLLVEYGEPCERGALVIEVEEFVPPLRGLFAELGIIAPPGIHPAKEPAAERGRPDGMPF
jgi:crossover junction endodeoxyribonuclease RusA